VLTVAVLALVHLRDRPLDKHLAIGQTVPHREEALLLIDDVGLVPNMIIDAVRGILLAGAELPNLFDNLRHLRRSRRQRLLTPYEASCSPAPNDRTCSSISEISAVVSASAC